jgi:hypothetical protein
MRVDRDNGRLSGTSADERLDGEPHGAQRPYADPLARTLGVGSDAFMSMSPLTNSHGAIPVSALCSERPVLRVEPVIIDLCSSERD